MRSYFSSAGLYWKVSRWLTPPLMNSEITDFARGLNCGGKYIGLYGCARTDCRPSDAPPSSLIRLLNVDKLVQVQQHMSQIAQRRARGAVTATRAFRPLLKKRYILAHLARRGFTAEGDPVHFADLFLWIGAGCLPDAVGKVFRLDQREFVVQQRQGLRRNRTHRAPLGGYI